MNTNKHLKIYLNNFTYPYCFLFVWADPAGGEIGASVNSWQKNTPGSALKTILMLYPTYIKNLNN